MELFSAVWAEAYLAIASSGIFGGHLLEGEYDSRMVHERLIHRDVGGMIIYGQIIPAVCYICAKTNVILACFKREFRGNPELDLDKSIRG